MILSDQNIMVILSSPSGVGKTTLTKKFNKSTTPLKFQFPTLQDQLGLMKSKELIISL